MATNDILPFCPTDLGTNLLDQATYAGATDRASGNKPGVASAKLNNKALRQCAFLASQLAQYISDKTGLNVIDDANTANLMIVIKAALQYLVIQSISGSGTVNDNTDVAECTGTGTITLPTSPETGTEVIIKKTDSGTTTTIGSSVDGATVTLETAGQFIDLYFNGTWKQKG